MSDRAVTTLDQHWDDLVTAALLGTDRRQPPRPPVEPVADLVDDAVRVDDAARMLVTVAAVASARRAAFVAMPSATPLQAPVVDTRPMVSVAAAATWRTIVDEWAVLEDEWMLAVCDAGQRLSPDVLVAALARHRNDAARRLRAAIAGGTVSGWLLELVPQLAGNGRGAPAEAVACLPELAVPPDLAELLAVDAHTFCRRLMVGFDAGLYGPAHRPVLTNLIARCRREVLRDAAGALSVHGSGLAHALADLARLRHRMLAELGV